MRQFDGMEHRLTSRTNVAIEAVVELHGGRRVRGTIRNVSLTGLYLEMPHEHAAAVHGVIKLAFPLPGSDGVGETETLAHWQGFIVRRDGGGVGAVFDSDVEEDWGGLAGLLGAVNPTASHDRQFLHRCLQYLIE